MNGKDFFEHSASSSDFSSMKLLKDIFDKMKNEDDIESYQIVQNIHNLLNTERVSRYFFIETDEYMSDKFANYDTVKYGMGTGIKTNLDSTTELVSHEFGHMLFDVVGNVKVPDDYFAVKTKTIQNLNMNSSEIINFLNYARDYEEKLRNESILEAQKYVIDHEDEVNAFVNETLKSLFNLIEAARIARLDQKGIDDLSSKYLAGENSELFINRVKKLYEWKMEDQIFSKNKKFDHECQLLYMVAGLIDSVYEGENPYYDSIYAIDHLRSHVPSYYREVKTRGFDEQFADYVALRINKDTYDAIIPILRKWFGEDWFTMMEKYYFYIADTIVHMKDDSQLSTSDDFNVSSSKLR